MFNPTHQVNNEKNTQSREQPKYKCNMIITYKKLSNFQESNSRCTRAHRPSGPVACSLVRPCMNCGCGMKKCLTTSGTCVARASVAAPDMVGERTLMPPRRGVNRRDDQIKLFPWKLELHWHRRLDRVLGRLDRPAQ
jgi:hypothetical protein